MTTAQRTVKLTPREHEVAQALCREGGSNGDIAAALHVSEETVKTHLRHVMAKVGARTRTELALILVRGGVDLTVDGR